MSEPILYFTWNGHASELISVYKTYLENNSFVDCTISAEGKSLNAHRLILSACSPYFRMLFSEEREKHPIVILKDTLFSTLKTVIDFVYDGKVMITANQLEAFLELAVSLQIKGLNNSLRKDKETNNDVNAHGNTPQYPSRDKKDNCEVKRNETSPESISSNSSHQLNFHFSRININTLQTDKSIPLEERSEVVQSESALISLQSRPKPRVQSDTPVSINTEINVKREPLYSEIQILDTKNEGHQSHLLHNDHVMSVNTETSAKQKPLYSDIDLLEKIHKALNSVQRDESMCENFVSDVNDDPAATLAHDLDQYSRGSEHLRMKENSAFVIPLQQQPHHNQQQDQQETRQQQQNQQITHLPRELSSPPEFAEQHDRSLRECSVSVGEKGVAGSEETVVALEVTENDTDETDEVTEHSLRKSRNSCSSAGGPQHDEDQLQAMQQRGRRPRRAKSKTIPLQTPMQARARPTRTSTFKCGPCDLISTSSQGLKDRKRKHAGRGSYHCDVCGKTFVYLRCINRHKLSHSGERPHSCDICRKSFSQSSTLAAHKRLHSGGYPYSCDICEEGFFRPSTLASHKRIHTGKHQYACDVCEKTFRESTNLRLHRRRHFKGRKLNCVVCSRVFFSKSALILHLRKMHASPQLT